VKMWWTSFRWLCVQVFGQPSQVTVHPMLRDRCPVCPLRNVGVLWPHGWTDQDVTWYGGRPRPRRHCVRWGPSSPTERDTAVPLFSTLVYCGQTAGWIRIPPGKEISLGSGDIVLDGDPAPPRKGAEQPPHFSAHVCRGQTVAHLSNC